MWYVETLLWFNVIGGALGAGLSLGLSRGSQFAINLLGLALATPALIIVHRSIN